MTNIQQEQGVVVAVVV